MHGYGVERLVSFCSPIDGSGDGDLTLRCLLVGETQYYRVNKQCPRLLLSQWAYIRLLH